MTSAKKIKVESDAFWHILVVDDDHDIHALTCIVLENIQFENKRLKIHSAFSGKEACDFIKENDFISLILLDVVMEEEDSGFQVVKYIREELKNKKIRIILRTGQPGFAIESSIITKYDINDYKLKTDLTANQFKTSLISALKSYKEISELSKVPSSHISNQPLQLEWDHLKDELKHFKNNHLNPEQVKHFNATESTLKQIEKILKKLSII